MIWLSIDARSGLQSTLGVPLAKIPAEGSRFLFAAAESQAILEIQQVLRENPKLQRNEWKAYSYWKLGQSESQSAGERRTIAPQ